MIDLDHLASLGATATQEAHEGMESARFREKQMKEWRGAWKLRDIEGLIPEWADLYEQIASPA